VIAALVGSPSPDEAARAAAVAECRPGEHDRVRTRLPRRAGRRRLGRPLLRAADRSHRGG